MTNTTKRYRGSCHCGAVTFEADLDLSKGTSRCNCSICTKTQTWGAMCRPEDFRLLSGEDALGDYQWGTKTGHHLFCKHCGVRPFGRGAGEWAGGEYVSINLHCLDDLDPTGLVIHYLDGRANTWAPLRTEQL